MKPDTWMPESFQKMVDSQTYFCVFVNDEIVSATSVETVPNKPDNTVSTGIDTIEQHRRKGYASIACAAFIKHHLNRDIVPIWFCDFKNTASEKLATKLGFRYVGNVFFISSFLLEL
jgi:predicted GNAT family acetyltransferase